MKFLLSLMIFSTLAMAARIKDIAILKGARPNQLFGYGIVVGLPGTGDKANDLTQSSLGLVLKGMGVDVKDQKMDTKNAASVVVTATLPSFAKTGTKIDVNVSSVGTAASLENGTLMMSSLRGADGKVYAMATGKVVSLKKGGGGGGGGQEKVGATGIVPGGAILERELTQNFTDLKELRYSLFTPDFTTAVRVSHRVNEELGGKYANAVDAGTVDIIPPYHFEGNLVELIAQVESIEVEADSRAKVVINPRTGTVVLGEQVRIAPVAIAHGNLKIEVKEERAPNAAPADGGDEAAAKDAKVMLMKRGTSIAEIAASMNEMGASSEDLISLLQALKSSGSLMAEVEMQ